MAVTPFTMVDVRGSRPRFITNDWSTLSTSTGKRCRYDSDE